MRFITDARSALLSMLPPPKRKLPTTAASRGSTLSVNKSMAAKPADDLKASLGAKEEVEETEGPSLVPASVKRKAAKEEEMDLFGLCELPT